jgi:thiol-disulfide isomerase/thioredoxin
MKTRIHPEQGIRSTIFILRSAYFAEVASATKAESSASATENGSFGISGLIKGRLVFALAFLVLFSSSAPGKMDEAGEAPGFKLVPVGREHDGRDEHDEHDEKISLTDLRGKIVYLTFFNEGCVPCRDEVPFLNQLAKKSPEDLVVIGIGYQDPRPRHLLGVKERMGIEFIVLVDEKGLVARAYRVFGIPAGFLINERGEMVKRYIGMDERRLESDVDAELARLGELKANRSIWVDEFNEVTAAAEVQNLGTKVRHAIHESLKQKGYPVAGKKGDAGFIIKGSVSGLGLISGVNIQILRPDSRKPLEEFSMAPPGNDFSRVAEEIINCIEKP